MTPRFIDALEQLAVLEEREVVRMLGQWLSELEPIAAYRQFDLIGLTVATPMGVEAPIVVPVSAAFKRARWCLTVLNNL